MRLPQALKVALETVAPVIPISPTPRSLIGERGSGMAVHNHLDLVRVSQV